MAANHGVQILSLPDMFLRWDRGGPRPWPEDCCRIGLSRIEDSDSIIPCVFIGIMWRSLETDENFRKSHLHSMMFLFFIIIFPGLPRSWLESGGTAAVWLYLWRFSWNINEITVEIHKENLGLLKSYQNTIHMISYYNISSILLQRRG